MYFCNAIKKRGILILRFFTLTSEPQNFHAIEYYYNSKIRNPSYVLKLLFKYYVTIDYMLKSNKLVKNKWNGNRYQNWS